MQVTSLNLSHFNEVEKILEGHKTQSNFVSFGLQWTEKQIQEALKAKAFGLWIEQELIAFIFFRALGLHLFELDLMATHIDKMHKNYMGQLFMESLKQLPSGTEIWLEVHQDNFKAQGFYKKHGFLKVGERNSYYPDGKKALLMTFKQHQ